MIFLLNQLCFSSCVCTLFQSSWFYYLASAVLLLLVLLGLAQMAKVETSVKGNRLGAMAMLLAVVLTLLHYNIFSVLELWVAMLIGSVLGLVLALKVRMIQMPQMVGLLNGFGGLASMIAATLSLFIALPAGSSADGFNLATAGLAIVVGGLTFSGSMVAAGKLHKLLDQKPKVYPRHQLWTMATLGLALLTVPALLFISYNNTGLKLTLALAAMILANLFGYFFSIRVGGADMPITISLLNSFSGVAGSIAGMAINDPLLVAVGGVVGASGLLLTQIMCKAMNRKLFDILLGKTSTPLVRPQQASVSQSTAPPQSSSSAKADTSATTAVSSPSQVVPPDSTAQPNASAATSATTQLPQWLTALQTAERVIIVPGYGMALSQAQALVKQLADKLEHEGKQVDFAIHPVAGRMPGHMNVLLAEVDVPYEKLKEMQEINEQFADCDLVLVVGANDVVNPAANTAVGTPIYGMPVLAVEKAKHILMLNFDAKPGYAGVENPLYQEAQTSAQHVSLLLGDAKEKLNQVLDAWKNLDSQTAAPAEADSLGNPAAPAAGESTKARLSRLMQQAQQVIIVPGYGMALSQAQGLVKQLADQLERSGKQLDFAIHPVAGRMPGHMNVLLAEVDVPYEKLKEMQEINPEFSNCDLVLVVGANDVVNPAANTAVGTPIYGMPVLAVENAKHVLILNFDAKPGYAGVENPLYREANSSHEHVSLLLGDAKESLQQLLDLL